MSPLIVLWQDIRELRTTDESGVWLSAAASLALTEAGPHDEEGCYCDDLDSDEVDCEWSLLCLVKMVTKALIAQATQEAEDDLSFTIEPTDAITQVRMQLAAAGELGLLSKTRVRDSCSGTWRSVLLRMNNRILAYSIF